MAKYAPTRKVWFSLVPAVVLAATAFGQVPTKEERVRDSSLNPEYQATWRSGFVRLPREGAAPLAGCYRKEFVLPAAPRKAQFSFFTSSSPAYAIAINGRILESPQSGQFQTGGLKNYDLTADVKAGKNVITFRGEYRDASSAQLLAEGIVFCQDGNTLRLLSDGWTGGWGLPAGWDKPEADAAAMRPLLADDRPARGRSPTCPCGPITAPSNCRP